MRNSEKPGVIEFVRCAFNHLYENEVVHVLVTVEHLGTARAMFIARAIFRFLLRESIAVTSNHRDHDLIRRRQE